VSRVQSLSRAFAVLDALGGPPLGVTAIAARVGLPKSTTGRLLQALADEGLVEQVKGGTDYRIGERILAWSASARPSRSLVALVRPHLQALALATGEAGGLSVPDGWTVHHLHQEEGDPHPVLVRDWTGSRLPMHVTAPGLVFLANMRPDELDRYLARPLEQLARGSMTDPALLRARVARISADGWSWTRDEVADGISSVAAAIGDASGEVVGAVHVHWPTYRFPDRAALAAAAIPERVVATAAAITADLRRAG
jgi:DNA-binding IclR family transcriptional regulator